MELRAYPRIYLATDFDPSDAQSAAAVFRELEERPIEGRAELERWLGDWQEATAAAMERYSRAYLDMTRDTTNAGAKSDYLGMLENLLPLLTRADFELQRKLLSSPALSELDSDFYNTFLRGVRAEVEIFSEANVPLLMEEERLSQEYQEIAGNESVEFRGTTYTIDEMAPFLEETERDTREAAWRARAGAKLESAPKLEDLYERMFAVRRQLAANAGESDFRAYIWKAKKRFDYTPADTITFHEAIRRHVVPVLQRDAARRKGLLGVETLRPWDMAADPDERQPLRPFETVEQLIAGSRRIFERLDPQLGEFFGYMADNDLLDLDNRAGKGPGGYQSSLHEQRLPFIFMNAVGTKRDVETVLHESGHAFNELLARDQALVAYRTPGAEFAEVASMAMELLARDQLDVFYSPDDLSRLYSDQLRNVLRLFTEIASYDAFQHWFYTTPDHDATARGVKWAELVGQFQPWVDWSGLEEYRDIGWQILHVLIVPFYVIEYAIAQLAALRIWLNSRHDHAAALSAYKAALALGGSRPLPELFAAAGARFGLDDEIVGEIMREVEAEMWRGYE